MDSNSLLRYAGTTPPLANRVQKIVRLTGEFDREGWNGAGKPSTLSIKLRADSVPSADPGASFTHQDRPHFLFGNTRRAGHRNPDDEPDSITYSTDKTIEDGRGLRSPASRDISPDGALGRGALLNVSATIVDAEDHALPGSGPQLVNFGGGRYAASGVYLAVKTRREYNADRSPIGPAAS